MKIMISAGEASGDMHASAVIKEIKKIIPSADIFGMGGSQMQAAGARIIYDINNLGIIGIVEVVRHIPFFLKLKKYLKETMKKEKPDVLVCVDYPGFNMRLAKIARELSIPVVYYIAPTIWAWQKGRGAKIARDVKKVISIFPFEKEAYEKIGADVTYVGNPLIDTVKPSLSYADAMAYFHGDSKAKRILLMPGSRLNEIESLLPVMLKAARLLLQKMSCQFFLPKASTIPKEKLTDILEKYPDVPVNITNDKTYDLMQISTVCIASSGTATLETALMKLPTVLVYRLSPLTWFLAKRLVHVSYVGLPNILLGKEITPELLQNQVTAESIAYIVGKWITEEQLLEKNRKALEDVRRLLDIGGAVRQAAQIIIETAGDAHG